MPVRFRCAYCNQLMAISRRKIGKVVRCPKCAGEIIVPSPDGLPPAEETGPNAAFDDPNFDAGMDDPVSASPTVKAPAESRVPSYEDTMSATPNISHNRRGLFLPLGLLIISLGVVFLLLILVFVIGLIVGKSMASADKKAAAGPNPEIHLRALV